MNQIARLVTCVTLVLVVMLVGSNAFACSCGFATVEENLKSASAVFWGEVTKTEDVAGRWGGSFEATFTVRKWFKGGKSKSMAVTTTRQSTACGINFAIGESYLVFAYSRDGKYGTSSCSSTRPMRVKPTSATKPPPARDLSREKRALDPVLRPLAEGVPSSCRGGHQFQLTVYNNGEIDIDRESECFDKYIEPKLQVPDLPPTYPFRVFVWMRDDRVELRYEADESIPLQRTNIRRALRFGVADMDPAQLLLRYQAAALDEWGHHRELEYACLLSGAAAAKRHMKAKARRNEKAKQALEHGEHTFYRCAVLRREWKRAQRLGAGLEDYQGRDLVLRIRAKTLEAEELPSNRSLAELGVTANEVLSFARKTSTWSDDVVLLDVVARALLERPGATAADRTLAAKAYARAAFLHHPVDLELSKRAIELGGEDVVDELDRARQVARSVQEKRTQGLFERHRKKGRSIPKAPK